MINNIEMITRFVSIMSYLCLASTQLLEKYGKI